LVGVGLVEAALGAAAAFARHEPDRAVLIGTAGLLPGATPRLGPPAAILVREACLADAAVASGRAYFPPPLPVRISLKIPDRRATSHGRVRAARPARPSPSAPPTAAASVACPPGITRSTAVARSLAQHTGAALENLEVFAVARAAERAGVPLTVVLGVSNRVGPNSHAEWRDHAAAAAASACDLAWEIALPL
jgi:nucleoside phosphorylase